MALKEDILVPERKYRYDFYQTDSHVIVTLFIKNAPKNEVQIDFEEKEVSVVVPIPSEEKYSYITKFHLWDSVDPSECLFKVYSTKIEIKLKKVECLKWDLLESVQNIDSSCKSDIDTAYPSSSKTKHDWNKIEADVKRSEETEKPEGDAALNQLFQKIYADGSEEVKKAMNKSFMESGGTVLSTNWKEVGTKNVEVKAPDGMEWKEWEK